RIQSRGPQEKIMFSFFKKIKSKVRFKSAGRLYRIGANPAADWLVILCGFAIFVAIAIATTFSLYGGLFSDSAISSASSTPALLNLSDLDRVLRYFDARAEAKDIIMQHPVTVPDPSK